MSTQTTEKEITHVDSPERIHKILVVGLTPMGRHSLFEALTGCFPFCVEFSADRADRTVREKQNLGSETFEIVDYTMDPIQCLFADNGYFMSIREFSRKVDSAVRDMIFTEEPDIVTLCISDSRLLTKPSLILSRVLLEYGIPVVIYLSKATGDIGKRIWLCSYELEKLLGVSVYEKVNCSCTNNLIKAIRSAWITQWSIQPLNSIHKEISSIKSILPDDLYYKRMIAILLLCKDSMVIEYVERKCGVEKARQLEYKVDNLHAELGVNYETILYKNRQRWVRQAVKRATRLPPGEFSRSCLKVLSFAMNEVILFLIIIICFCIMGIILLTISSIWH